jgi:hypothetical protein
MPTAYTIAAAPIQGLPRAAAVGSVQVAKIDELRLDGVSDQVAARTTAPFFDPR